MFYLTTHSTHFIYGYIASDIWLRTILIVRKETRCRHIGYSYLLTARVLLYVPSHRQDNTYHGPCYTSRGTLAGTRNSSNNNKGFELAVFSYVYCHYLPIPARHSASEFDSFHPANDKDTQRQDEIKMVAEVGDTNLQRHLCRL